MPDEERLTSEELGAETGADAARLVALADAGILEPAADGSFRPGDVQRVLVAGALEEAGLSLELMRRGIEAGVVSFEDTDVIYASPGRRDGSVEEIAGELGLPTEVLLRILTALGLPRPDPGTRLHEPDREQLRAFVAAWSAFGDEDLMVRAARAYGDATRRAAEGWLGLFEEVVMASMADRAVPWTEMRQRAVEPGRRLLGAGRSMLPWLLDQHLFQLLNRMNFDSIERQLAVLGVAAPAPREPSAIVFADLAGYTRLTEERGDEVAAASATRLAELANEVAAHHGGRLVKLLGDGVMLHFERPQDAVAAAFALRDAAAAGLPPTHTGIAAGMVIRRESDYFGRTVNLAARLSGQAGPGEILVTEDLLRAAGDAPGLAGATQLSPLALKGIPEPIPAFRLG